MKKLLYLCLTAAILVSSLLAAGCSLNPSQPKPTEPAPSGEGPKQVVSATGAVVPLQWSTLSLTTGGVISELLVEEGQQVEKGQVLARLQGQEPLTAALNAAELELTAANKDLTDLTEGASAATAAAQLRLANAEKALDKAKERRQGKNYKRADESLIAAGKADLIMARDEFKRAQDMWNNFVDKPEEDVNRAYALAQYEAARRKRDRAEWNVNYLESMPDQMEVNISEGELVVAQAEQEAARRAWERVKNGPDPRLLELAQARVKSAQAQLDAARKALENLELKAPFGGTVSRLLVHRQEWLNPGQPVLQLADLTRLRVETTDLNEIDAAMINVNDLVDVSFDALPDVKIMGKVARISDKAAEGAGVNYPVVIELAERPEKLRWGMTAFVDIKIKK